jgi:catechol 2,3-dioxygenase-like lactoylglutathione lyase family enzyme
VITGIDHVVIGVRDLGAATSAYETLFGCAASAREERDGVATAMLVTHNVAVELMAPVGESEGAARLRAAIEDGGEGLKSLVFATSDIVKAHRRCERVGLAPQAIVEREAWRSVRLETTRTRGVRVFVMQRTGPLQAQSDAIVSGLDHVVVRSGDTDGAASLYEDRLWGLSWRVQDADAARARLAAASVNVSEVRVGFKPGTRVFTVRDKTCGIPTLMIEASREHD